MLLITVQGRIIMCNHNHKHKCNHNHSNNTNHTIGSLALKQNRLITNNQATKYDPTQSKTLRNQYSAAMYNRFRNLKGLINTTIIKNDAMNLKDPQIRTILKVLEAIPAYDFPADKTTGKVNQFKEWLQNTIDEGILEITDESGNIITSAEHWQNTYIRTAYAKGLRKSTTLLKTKGIDLPDQRIVTMFNAPIHSETLETLYMRNFNELKGITNVMDQQISRELVNGLSQGHNPRKIARVINDRVDKIGITRSRMLARTEVIRSFNEAALNRYQQAGVGEVEMEVEWLHAADACPQCVGLASQGPYTLSEARGMIPAHPN